MAVVLHAIMEIRDWTRAPPRAELLTNSANKVSSGFIPYSYCSRQAIEEERRRGEERREGQRRGEERGDKEKRGDKERRAETRRGNNESRTNRGEQVGFTRRLPAVCIFTKTEYISPLLLQVR